MQSSQAQIIIRLFISVETIRKKVINILSDYKIIVEEKPFSKIDDNKYVYINIVDSKSANLKDVDNADNCILITKLDTNNQKYLASIKETDIDKMLLQTVNKALQQKLLDRINNKATYTECDNLKYKEFCDNSLDVIWLFDVNKMRITYISPSIKKLRGYTPEEILNTEAKDLVEKDSFDLIKKLISEEIQKIKNGKTNDTLTIDVEQKHKNGSTIFVEMTLHGMYNSANNTFNIQGSSRDITERKNKDKIIADYTLEMEKVYDSSHSLIFILDKNLVINRVNTAAVNFCNKSKNNIIGCTLCSVMMCDTYIKNKSTCHECTLSNKIKNTFETNDSCKKIEIQFLRKIEGKKKVFYFIATTTIIHKQGKAYTILYMLNTTKEHELSEKVVLNYNYLSTFLNASNRALYIKDERNGYIFANKPFTQLSGKSIKEIIGNIPVNILPPYLFSIFEKNDSKALKQNRLITSKEQIGPRHFRLTNFPLPMENGTIGVGCIIEDESEYIKTINNLFYSQKRYTALLENVPGMVYRCVPVYEGKSKTKWIITYASSGCQKLLGYSVEELLYQDSLTFNGTINQEYVDTQINRWRDSFVTNKAMSCEIEITTKFGEHKWISNIGTTFKNDKGNIEYIEGFASDITQLKKALLKANISEQYLSSFLNNSPDYSYIKDENRRYIWGCNTPLHGKDASFSNFIGLTDDEIPNNNFKELLKLSEDAMLEKGSLYVSVKEFEGRTYNATKFPIPLPNNKIGIGAILKDITIKIEAENKIKQQQKEYSTLLANIPGIVYRNSINDNFSTIYISDGAERITGYTIDEIINKKSISLYDIISKEYKNKVAKTWKKNITEKSAFSIEYEIICKDGSRKWLWDRSQAALDENNNITYIEGYLMDITHIKQLNKTIEQNETKFRSIAETMKDVVWISDAETLNITYLSPSAARLFGHINKNTLKLSTSKLKEQKNLLIDKLKASIPKMIEDFKNGNITEKDFFTFNTSYINNNNDNIYTELVIHLAKNQYTGKIEIYGLTRDVTSEQKALKLAQENERQFRTLVDSLQGIVYKCLCTENLTMTFLNDNAKFITGYNNEDLLNDNKLSFRDIIHPSDRKSVWQAVQNSAKGNGHFSCEYRIIAKNKSIKWVSEKGHIVFTDSNKPLHIEGFINDITELKLKEQIISENEKKFHLLADNSKDIIFTCNTQYFITYASPAIKTILNISSDEAVGRSIMEFIPAENLIDASSVIKNYISNKTKQKTILQTVLQNENYQIHAEINLSQIFKNNKIVGLQGMIRDISDRKQHEKAIIDAAIRSEWLVEGASNGVVIFDNNSKIIYSNKKMLTIFGYGEDIKTRGIDVNELFALDKDHNMYDLIKYRLGIGKNVIINKYLIKRIDGSEFYAKIHANILSQSKENYEIEVIIEDISKIITNERIVTRQRLSDKSISTLMQILLRPNIGFNDAVEHTLHHIHLLFDSERTHIFINNDVIKMLNLDNTKTKTNFSISRTKKGTALAEYGTNLKIIIENSFSDSSSLTQFNNIKSDNPITTANSNNFKINNIVICPIINISDIKWGYIVIENKNEQFNDIDVSNISRLSEVLCSFFTKIKFVSELTHSKNKFDLLVNNIENIFFIVNNMFSDIEFVSPTIEKVLGIKLDEINCSIKTYLKFIDKSNLRKFINTLKDINVSNDTKPRNVEIIFNNKGVKKNLMIDLFPIKDNTKNIKRIAGIVSDITMQKNKAKSEANALITGEENERSRFAYELNDCLGPHLATLRMFMQALVRLNDTNKIKDIAKKSEVIFYEAIRILTEISNNLSPHVLHNYGAYEAIKHFSEKLKQIYDVKINITSINNERSEKIIETTIYRSLCEIINNSIKNNQCSEINISLNLTKNRSLINYSDNNIFDDKGIMNSQLTNIQNRIKNINGKLSFQSTNEGFFAAEIIIDNNI